MNSDKMIFLYVLVFLTFHIGIPSSLSAGEQSPARNESVVESGRPAETSSDRGGQKIIRLETGASCISLSCHDTMGKKKYLHAVGVNGKQCVICHHVAQEGIHAFSEIGPVTRPLCAKCHSEESTPPPENRKKPPVVISGDGELILHKPFQDGKCTECHDAHESDFFRHLKYQYPEGIYAPFSEQAYSLCMHCHREFDQVLEEPRTLSLTMFRNGNLNLHFRHVNKKKGRGCSICHHQHGTKNPALLNDAFIFGKRLLSIGFEKSETGGKCATTCHRTAKYDRYKPVFNLIKTSPRPGEDATEDELKESREQDMKREKERAARERGGNVQEEPTK